MISNLLKYKLSEYTKEDLKDIINTAKSHSKAIKSLIEPKKELEIELNRLKLLDKNSIGEVYPLLIELLKSLS